MHLNASHVSSRFLYTVCVEWMYTSMTTSQCQSNKAIDETVFYRILRAHFGNKNELRMLSNGILSFTITSQPSQDSTSHPFFGPHSISHTFFLTSANICRKDFWNRVRDEITNSPPAANETEILWMPLNPFLDIY